jgi:hypothetical protein
VILESDWDIVGGSDIETMIREDKGVNAPRAPLENSGTRLLINKPFLICLVHGGGVVCIVFTGIGSVLGTLPLGMSSGGFSIATLAPRATAIFCGLAAVESLNRPRPTTLCAVFLAGGRCMQPP